MLDFILIIEVLYFLVLELLFETKALGMPNLVIVFFQRKVFTLTPQC